MFILARTADSNCALTEHNMIACKYLQQQFPYLNISGIREGTNKILGQSGDLGKYKFPLVWHFWTGLEV